ncbi:DUF6415 family natural product biosynthesis protein [Streptomyces jumonjinensis]|uniref:Uncharacterized protein n=1 Tax=Streptomyces jumonjinensis TaxID=1945 RepID=A0A646KR65_STRJU|nr:DUF6415 family natural product biosynthesis protein [Streptomyces jumonjinensis]MQT04819.1 hypothetical protein [Streptomyces jumonjinensis]
MTAVPTALDDLPVRDAAAGARRVEPARPASQDLLLKLTSSLRKSFIEEGVEDVLERILGWGAEALSPEETRNLVRSLRACLWPLVTGALHDTKGRPDDVLRQLVKAAVRLDAEGGKEGFMPTESHARLLASLVSDLLDRAGDPESEGSK